MDGSELRENFRILKNEFTEIKERLKAVEIEQRRIREDLLSGEATERMKKRMLQNPNKEIRKIKKKIDEDISIKI
jgi:hypothetical protein